MQVASNRLGEELSAVTDLTVRPAVELAGFTTFRIGGPAEWLIDVPTLRGLCSLLQIVQRERVPFCLLGLGSNVLIPDAGLPGIVARLTGYFRRTRVFGTRVSAGAAIPLAQLARKMSKRGLLGLEALSGFPSTVGGAVFMNAGCYGTEIKDILIRASVVDSSGRLRRIAAEGLGAGYRSTLLQETGEIVTRATFQLQEGDGEEAMERMQQLNRKRWDSLPSGHPNAGSIFRNPEGDYAGRLIEAVGLKGERRGDAEISEKHANVIVNRGSATAAEVLQLMAEARDRVWSSFAVALEPEIVLAGALRPRWMQITEGEGLA